MRKVREAIFAGIRIGHIQYLGGGVRGGEVAGGDWVVLTSLSSWNWNEEDPGRHVQDQVANPKDQDEDHPTHDSAVAIITHDVFPFSFAEVRC